MGRIYTANFAGVAVTAAQDLFEILAASGKPFILHRCVVTQESDYGDTAAEGLRFSIARATGSYTSGSGGSTTTLRPHNTSDTAAGPTPEINNTSRAAAGSGALTRLVTEAANIQTGWDYFPAPEHRFIFAAAEACVIGLEAAPADSLTMSGWVVIEELC